MKLLHVFFADTVVIAVVVVVVIEV